MRALIAIGVVTALIGLLLPLFVDSPPYPQGNPTMSRSLLDRLLRR